MSNSKLFLNARIISSVRAAVLVCATAMAAAVGARAQPFSKVVVVVYSGLQKTAVRITAELSSIGFQPEKEEAPPSIPYSELKRIAEKHHAAAVMRVSPEGNSVQVWVVDQDDEVTVLQEVVVPLDNEQADMLVAFKSVELLRASLMPLPPAASIEKKAPRPAPAAAQTSRSRADDGFPRLFAALAPSAVFGFGGLPPALNLGLSLHMQIAPRTGIDVSGLIPLFPMKVTVQEGNIEVSDGIAAAGIRLFLLPLKRRVIPSLSIFGGALILKARGRRANPVYEGHTAVLVAAVMGGAFTLTFAINEIFALRADASAGVAMPKPVLRAVDEDAVSFGRPIVSVLFGVEVKLW